MDAGPLASFRESKTSFHPPYPMALTDDNIGCYHDKFNHETGPNIRRNAQGDRGIIAMPSKAREDDVSLSHSDISLVVVLVEPQIPGNVGAVARSMANFGLPALRLVCRDQGAILEEEETLRRARWAVPLLENAEVYEDLKSALVGCSTAWGTSSHPWNHCATIDSRQFGKEVAENVLGPPVALVMGRERQGLSKEEQSLCRGVVRISTRSSYRDLNLSHAACILLYEASLGCWTKEGRPPSQSEPAPASIDAMRPGPPLPEVDETQRFVEDAQDLFMDIGYLKKETAGPFTMRLSAWLGRKPITREELLTMQGMIHRIRLALRRARKE